MLGFLLLAALAAGACGDNSPTVDPSGPQTPPERTTPGAYPDKIIPSPGTKEEPAAVASGETYSIRYTVVDASAGVVAVRDDGKIWHAQCGRASYNPTHLTHKADTPWEWGHVITFFLVHHRDRDCEWIESGENWREANPKAVAYFKFSE
jgi:hypothetical protein